MSKREKKNVMLGGVEGNEEKARELYVLHTSVSPGTASARVTTQRGFTPATGRAERRRAPMANAELVEELMLMDCIVKDKRRYFYGATEIQNAEKCECVAPGKPVP